jgi:aldose sugar dehydrogenase
MGIIWYSILILLVSTMIFSANASCFGIQTKSNETNKNYNQKDGQTKLDGEVVDKKSGLKINMYSNPSFTLFDNQSAIVSFGLPSFWNSLPTTCNASFRCTPVVSTGWKDKTSFQISTTNNTNQTWSWIYGQEIDVKPKERYQLVIHMKLNDWATQSHVALEGFNETLQQWYRIEQCPSGINGPLEWHEFNCTIVIPDNTDKLRSVLNAGWSSQSGKEATTWFDSINMIKVGSRIDTNTQFFRETNKNYNQKDGQTKLDGEVVDKKSGLKINMYSNPSFTLFDNQSAIVSFGLPSFWNSLPTTCNASFRCTPVVSTGWKDKTSFQISTTNNTNQTWSWIYGQEIDVKPKERYQLVIHMKLNDWATQSHVNFEGFNETLQQWYRIEQCPSGINGPLEWHEFSCIITIPDNTPKIRPVLNAGWSSLTNKEATTWFDAINMIKFGGPKIFDLKLDAEVVYQGLDLPISLAFLGPNDILVLEKNKGTVQRIVNGVKVGEPLIDLDVASKTDNQGLLGIAVQKNSNKTQSSTKEETTYVFLYFSAMEKDSNNATGKKSLRNMLYRYEFSNNALLHPKLLLDIPSGDWHNGEKMLIGPNKNLYLIVGEIRDPSHVYAYQRNRALNYEGKHAHDPDGRGGVLVMDQNGKAIARHGILGDKMPLKMYYAYGIRNSFGLDFDPLTGKLWDTENGPAFGDEINLVEPGFNSGWNKVQGIWNVTNDRNKNKIGLASESPDNLTDFGGRGKYSPPEFTWNYPVAPTAIKFISTGKLGKEYQNDVLVADVHGRVYHFDLTQNRTSLHLQGPLVDKVADNDKELNDVIFGNDFSLISDMEIGPDGYPYLVDLNAGIIYRIVPYHFNEHLLNYLDKLSKYRPVIY